jgi:hypothetical protein
MKLPDTFTAFALPLLLAACTAAPTGDRAAARAATGLFPLAVGEYWVYEIRAGNQTSTVENRITASHTIGDTEWFLSVEYGEKFWIRNSAEGQVEAVNLYSKSETAAVFEQLDPKTLHEELLYKFPAQAGDSWVALENVLRYEGKKTLTVPAGTFECHSYSITQYGQTYSHSCIAEGVGVVYSDNTLPDGQLEISRLKDWGGRK